MRIKKREDPAILVQDGWDTKVEQEEKKESEKKKSVGVTEELHVWVSSGIM